MRLGLVTFLALGILGMVYPQEKGDVSLRVVKYDGLKEEVLKHRGKVVLVDFWGEY